MAVTEMELKKMESNHQSTTWKLALAYGLPNFGLAILLGPVQGLLQGYFTKHYDVKLEQIAWIFIMAPLLAGVVDPLVGMVSDHYRDRFWGRRSWLVGGAALSLFCTYHLFIVPRDLTVAYCGFWVILGFIAWTISEITYNAWGTELTSDYDSRTRIFSYKSAMGFIGTLIFLALPNLVALYQIHVQGVPAAQTSRDFTPLSMHVSFWFLAIAMPVFVVVALWVCPGGSHVRKTERKGPLEVVRILLSNKAMLIFMATYATLGISGGMQTAMGYLHLSTYLRLGQDASLIYTVACLSYLLGVPVWNRVAAALGRHVALMIGLSINIVLFVALGLLQPSTGEAAWLGKPAGVLVLPADLVRTELLPSGVLFAVTGDRRGYFRRRHVGDQGRPVGHVFRGLYLHLQTLDRHRLVAGPLHGRSGVRLQPQGRGAG